MRIKDRLKNRKLSLTGTILFIIVVLLLSASFYAYIFLPGSFSPDKELLASEKKLNYDPSEIVKSIDFDNGITYLCKYDGFFSAPTIHKDLIKWRSSDVNRYPIDKTKKVTHTWRSTLIDDNSKYLNKLYGHVNDTTIVSLELGFENNTSPVRHTLNESRLFLFHLITEDKELQPKYLKALDKNNNLIYYCQLK